MAKNSVGASLGQAMPKITQDDSTKEPTEWDTKDHLDTLIKAHEIMNNPVHLKAVHALAGRKQGAIKSIADIKTYANKKFGAGSSSSSKKNSLSQLSGGSANSDETPADDSDQD